MEQETRSVRGDVELREICKDTVRAICELTVADEQTEFVTPNAVSIAEAYFSDHAWFRAIYADNNPAGFVMLDDHPDKAEYFLWRFMIDSKYQRTGIGREAIRQLVQHVKTRPNASELLTSIVQAEGGPEGFYKSLGFTFTGEYEDGEALMRLEL